jgi:hypothetical protein
MLHWVIELARIRKARKAAVATISPIVERSRHRLGAISDAAWSDPYMIGFMVMLVSIIARVESGRLTRNSMSHVQCKVFEDITSMRSDVMAEELLLLTTSRNRDFELGCRNAVAFGMILLGTPIPSEGAGMPREDRRSDLLEVEFAKPFVECEDVSAAWEQFFDARLLAYDASAL